MQSRRHEEYVSLSPASKLRNHPRYEVGHNSYSASRRDVVDRSPRPQRRSVSPHAKTDGLRRILVREGRNGSIERRDYGWHLGAGRTERVRSGSPSLLPEHRKPHFDEDVVQRKYEYVDDNDYDDVKSNRIHHVYTYNDHHGESSRMSKEKDYNRDRIIGIDRHMMVPMEDGSVRGLHREPVDFIPNSTYGKTSEHPQLPSRSMDINQFEHEKLRYREQISPNNIPAMELYKEGKQPLFGSRDDSYAIKRASHSKDFGRMHFKGFAGPSSGVSRSEFPNSHREGMGMTVSDEYPRNTMKLSEPMDLGTYGQRSAVDIRNLDSGKRFMSSHVRGDYSPNGIEHNDYLYPKSPGILNDENIFPSQVHRMMPSRSQFDHEQARADFEYGELPRISITHPGADKIDPIENSYRNMRSSETWDHNLHKQAAMENLETNRIWYAAKHSGEYLDSEYNRVEFGRRLSRDDETSHLVGTQDHQVSHLRSNYGFGRDAGPQFTKERLQDPEISSYESEMQKLPVKRHRIKEEELAMYEPSNKMLKRQCTMEENINRHDPRNILPSKQYRPQEYEDAYDSGEEWVEGGLTALHSSRTKRFDQNTYRKANRVYDEKEYLGDFASEDWLSSQDSLAQSRKHSIRYFKPSSKYMKGQPRSGPVSWYNSHHNDKRSSIHRKPKPWKRSDEYDEDEQTNDDDPSEDWMKMAESEPCEEDSEEFKQLVHEAFLEYSKRLNLNSAVRRRYKEQGKAGSLFCIVCGRSSSKDFMDTQRLVTHAFMSHKAGLRARHLGLHKAICIMMGWNAYVPCDIKTWVPDILPDAEAWAQKEDLMLWPPLVIIHNISMSNNNPEQQKVIRIEGVEAFIRGKGFAGGKIKVCLGKPADQSVILVKFLGTFTGLSYAERLHKYFVENEHGREEFEQKTSNGGSSLEAGNAEDKLEEQLLYGYMGVADDLDRLDFNTKKWITVKSKKDIDDLENAPLKTDDR